jgi:hypothetical protein
MSHIRKRKASEDPESHNPASAGLSSAAKLHQEKKTLSATQVVKLRRQGGKIVQDCDVYIGRAMYRGGWKLPASKWANPITMAAVGGNRQEMLRRFKSYLRGRPDLLAQLGELRGKRLGCWYCVFDTTYYNFLLRCKPDACHGDVLAEMADHLKDAV